MSGVTSAGCVWLSVHRLALSTSKGEGSHRTTVFHINYHTTMASNPQRGLRSALLTNDNVGIFIRTVTKHTDPNKKKKTAQPMRQCSTRNKTSNAEHKHTLKRVSKRVIFSIV